MAWSRVRLRFARDLVVEFVDRDGALRQIEGIAVRGTRFPLVIYGPEGCGKTALFRQSTEIFRGHGYSTIYVDPLAESMEERVSVSSDVKDVALRILQKVEPTVAKLIEVAVEVAVQVLRYKRRVAIILDDVFQAVGVDRAEIYVKTLLNLIEYPPGDYERIAVIIGSSEGVTRERIGRHSWAETWLLWNMPRDGFRELYDRIPGAKPYFDDIWRATGGNPRYLSLLRERNWNVDMVASWIVDDRNLHMLVATLDRRQREVLEMSTEDPDVLLELLRESEDKEGISKLIDMLIERNLIMRLRSRDFGWIDAPPPERDPEIGVGRHIAWQTPLHREAVKKTLAEYER